MSNKPPKHGIIDPAIIETLKRHRLEYELVQTKRHWRLLVHGRQLAVFSRGNSKQERRGNLTHKLVANICRLAEELAAA